MANFPTEGDDIITGGAGDDTIDALGGNDVVRGGDGNDRLFGGPGEDSLYGQGGDDLLVGNTGNDKMFGGWGDDVMVWNNGDGSDLMEGGHEYDTAVVNGSNSAADEFTINPNGDRVDFDRINLVPFSLDIGTTEKLVVNGQGGDDIITGSAGLDGLIKLKLDGGDGNDAITGGDGDDKIYGGSDDDVLVGFRGNDKKYGGWGDDRLIWNNGDGSDLMEGGKGYDVVEVNGSNSDGDEFTIAANGHRVDFDRVNLVPFSLDIGTTEKLEVNGQGGDDKITAGYGLKHLIKLRLDGGDGDDLIKGGDGNDRIYGGKGDDYLAGRKGYDVLTGGEGHDTFVFDKGKDVITDFEHGKDKIVLKGYEWIDGYRDIKDRIEDHGDYATLDLGRHDLKVEDVSWLERSDFDWL
jgi:Ca2+-binding RTX toxin-like protein